MSYLLPPGGGVPPVYNTPVAALWDAENAPASILDNTDQPLPAMVIRGGAAGQWRGATRDATTSLTIAWRPQYTVASAVVSGVGFALMAASGGKFCTFFAKTGNSNQWIMERYTNNSTFDSTVGQVDAMPLEAGPPTRWRIERDVADLVVTASWNRTATGFREIIRDVGGFTFLGGITKAYITTLAGAGLAPQIAVLEADPA